MAMTDYCPWLINQKPKLQKIPTQSQLSSELPPSLFSLTYTPPPKQSPKSPTIRYKRKHIYQTSALIGLGSDEKVILTRKNIKSHLPHLQTYTYSVGDLMKMKVATLIKYQ